MHILLPTTAFCAAYLDGDGRADLAYTTGSGLNQASDLHVRKNLGSTFSADVSYSIPLIPPSGTVGAFPFIVAPGDYNGDGRVDLALVRTSGTGGGYGGVETLLRQSDGS